MNLINILKDLSLRNSTVQKFKRNLFFTLPYKNYGRDFLCGTVALWFEEGEWLEEIGGEVWKEAAVFELLEELAWERAGIVAVVVVIELLIWLLDEEVGDFPSSSSLLLLVWEMEKESSCSLKPGKCSSGDWAASFIAGAHLIREEFQLVQNVGINYKTVTISFHLITRLFPEVSSTGRTLTGRSAHRNRGHNQSVWL